MGGTWGRSLGRGTEARVCAGSQEFGVHHDLATDTLEDGTTAHLLPVKNNNKYDKLSQIYDKMKVYSFQVQHIVISIAKI